MSPALKTPAVWIRRYVSESPLAVSPAIWSVATTCAVSLRATLNDLFAPRSATPDGGSGAPIRQHWNPSVSFSPNQKTESPRTATVGAPDALFESPNPGAFDRSQLIPSVDR